MSRIPDYDQMRDMLAEYETECAEGDTIYDIIRYGNMGGWEAMKDEEVLESFVDFFGEHKIPKIDLDKEAIKREDLRIQNQGDDILEGRHEAMQRFTNRLNEKE